MKKEDLLDMIGEVNDKFIQDKKRPFKNNRILFNSDYKIFNNSEYVESEKKWNKIFTGYFILFACIVIAAFSLIMYMGLNEAFFSYNHSYTATHEPVWDGGTRVVMNQDGSYSLVVQWTGTITHKKGENFKIENIVIKPASSGTTTTDNKVYADDISFVIERYDETAEQWIPVEDPDYPLEAVKTVKLRITCISVGKFLTEEKAQTLYTDQYASIVVEIDGWRYDLSMIKDGKMQRTKVK